MNCIRPQLRPTRLAALLLALVAMLTFAMPAFAQTLTGVTVTVNQSTVTIDMTIDENPENSIITYYARYREQGSSSDWTQRQTFNRGTSIQLRLFNVPLGTTYDLEVSLDNSFPAGSTTITRTFTTGAPSFNVSSVTVGSITKTGATVTITSSGTPGSSTVYMEHRQSGGTWGGRQTSTTTNGTATFSLTGLTADTGYEVRASFDSRFPNALTQKRTFTTLPNTSLTSVTVTSSTITKTTAVATVSVTGASNTTIYLRHKKDSESEWTTAQMTTSSATVDFNLTGLTGNTNYTVEASLADNFSGSSTATFKTDPVAPTPPQSVSASDGGDGSINVSWSAPTDNGGTSVTSYIVYWKVSTTANYTHNSGDLSATASPYKIPAAGLTNGTPYKVKAVAKNSAGTSGDSNEDTATPTAKSGAPTITSVTSGNGTLTVSWSAPTNTGGSGITAFRVEWQASGSNWTGSDAGASATSQQITGLTNGISHNVRVAAKNKNGTGPWAASSGTPVAPPSVSGITQTSRTRMSLVLSVAIANPAGAMTVSLRHKPKSGSADWTTATPQPTTGSSQAFTLSGLTGNTEYTVEASLDGTFPSGQTVSADFTTAPVEPSAPQGVTAADNGDGSVTVSWTAPDDGGTNITQYKVEWKLASTDSWDGASSDTDNASPYTIAASSLTNGLSYDVRVTATNSEGTGPASSSYNVTPTAKPGAPTISGVVAGDTALTVSWTVPDNGGSSITANRVEWKLNSTAAWTGASSATPDASPHNITGLTNGSQYDVRVKVSNKNGEGDWAMGSGTPVDAPSISAIEQTSRTQISLVVSVTVDNPSGSDTVYLRHGPAGTTPGGTGWTEATSQSVSGSSASFTLAGLTGNTSYDVQASLNSDYSDSTTATLVTGPVEPGAPRNVAVTDNGDGTLSVSWDAPTSDGGADINSYEVEWKPASTESWTGASATTLVSSPHHISSGLTIRTAYSARVFASNSVGRGPASETASGTPTTAPGAPTGLKLRARSTSLRLSWTPPADNGGKAVTSYKVQWKSGSQSYDSSREATTAGASYNITGLTNGTKHDARVSAVNDNGSGSWLQGSRTPYSGPKIDDDDEGDCDDNIVGSITRNSARLAVNVVDLEGSTQRIFNYRYKEAGSSSWTSRETSFSITTPGATLSGLTANTTYEVQAAVNDRSFPAHRTSCARFTTLEVVADTQEKPGPPTVTSVAPGDGELTVHWTAPTDDGGSNITGYKVQWKSDSESFDSSRQHTAGASDRSYTIPSLTNGIPYDVQVIATNAIDDSDASNTRSGTPAAAVPKPGAPGVSVTHGDGTLTVNWTVPSYTGTSDIISYTVQWKSGTQSYDSPREHDAGASDRSHTIPNLTNGTPYDVQVKATNSSGDGAAGTSGGTPSTTPGTAPTITGTISPGRRELTVSWAAPSDNGGAPITSYRLQWRQVDPQASAQQFSSSRQETVTGTLYTIEDIPNRRHELRVAARNRNGEGPWSAVFEGTPGLPSAPQNLVLTRLDGGLAAAWNHPSTNGGFTLDRYRVEWRQAGQPSGAWSEAEADFLLAAYDIETLTNGTTYEVRVRAENRRGAGPWSAIARDAPSTVPGAPTVSSAELAQTTLTVTWTEPSDDGDSPITGYIVNWRTFGTTQFSPSRQRTTGSGATSVIITGLAAGTHYVVQVCAVNKNGDTCSATFNVAVGAGAPGKPTVTGWAASAHLTLKVEWSAPSEQGGTPIKRYDVQWSTSAAFSSVNEATTSGSTRSSEATGLTAGTQYHVRVRAVNDSGPRAEEAPDTPVAAESEWSNSLVATAVALLAAPTITALTVGDTTLAVTWTAPANTSVSDISSYKVQWKSGTQSFDSSRQHTAGASDTSYTITSLTNGVEYDVRVIAVGEIGDGNPSATMSGTPTAPVVPSAPTITSVEESDQTLVVNWSAPSITGSSNITGYTVQWKTGTQEFGGDTNREGTTTATSYTISGLVNGTTYEVQVIASNDSGAGPASAAGSGTPSTTPGTPIVTLQPGAVEGEQLAVTWTEPDNGGSAITEYRVQWKSGSESYNTTDRQAVVTSGRTYNIDTSATPTAEYAVIVTAVNDNGAGTASVEVTGKSSTVAGEPGLTSVVLNGGGSPLAENNTLTVTWTAPSDDGGADVSGYKVQWKSDSQVYDSSREHIAGASDSTYDITGLDGGAEYNVRVIAVNGNGDSQPSGESTTNVLGPPHPPTGVTVERGDEGGRLVVTWAASQVDALRPVEAYIVRWKSGSEEYDSTREIRVLPSEESQEITGLVNGTEHSVIVLAQNVAGESAPSTEASESPGAAPGAPQNVTVTPQNGALLVQWAAPSENGGFDVSEYLLEWKETSEDWQSGDSTTIDPNTQSLEHTISGLTDGTPYDIRLTASNEAGNGDPVIVTSSPGSGTSISGVSVAETTITQTEATATVSIANPDGASHTVYMRYGVLDAEDQPPSSWQEDQGDTVEDDVEFALIGLTANTDYEVQASLDVAFPEGARVSATFLTSSTVPGAPTGVTLNLLTDDPGTPKIQLSWSAPEDNGGEDISGYTVQWTLASEDFDGAQQQEASAGQSLTYTIEGLTIGETYIARVIASNINGNGEASEPTSLAATTRTSEPTSVTVLPGGDSVLVVSWDEPSELGGLSVTEYLVQWRSGDEEFDETDRQRTADASPYTLTGLTNGQVYSARVIAVNENGASAPSTEAQGTPIGVAGVPTSVQLQHGDAELTVQWQPPSGTAGGAVVGYIVQWTESGGAPTAGGQTSLEAQARSYNITELTNGTEYDVRVIALNPSGQSAPALISGMPSTVPGSPLIGSVVSGDGDLVVSWSAPADDGGADISGYTVQWKSGSQDFSASREQEVGADTLTYTIADLTNDTAYDVRVIATNINGDGEPSSSENGTPTEAVVPTVSSVGINPDSITQSEAVATVSIANTDEENPATVYLRHRSVAPAGEWSATQSASTTTGSAQFDLSDLSPGAQYEVQASLDAAFAEDASVSVTFTTASVESTVPGAPGDLLVTPGDGQLTVSWSAPDDGGSAIIEYSLEWKTGDEEFSDDRHAVVSGLSHTITGLTNGTAYDVSVTAVNINGSGTAAEGSGTPAQAAGTVITGVSVPEDGIDTTAATVTVSVANSDGQTRTIHLRYRAALADGEEENEWTAGPTAQTTSDGDVEIGLSGLSAGTEYEVQASFDSTFPDGESPGTIFTTLETSAQGTVPVAPSIAEVTSGDGEITITWAAPSEAGGPAIVSYDLRYIRSDAEDKSDANWTVETGIWTAPSEPTPGLPAPSDPCVADLGTLSADVTEGGEWTDECDSANREGSYARYYTFVLSDASVVRLDLNSDENAYLFLLRGAGADGIDVTHNDDIDVDNSDSRIEIHLAAGSYTVEATTLAAAVTGEFTLTVTEPTPAALHDCATDLGTLSADVTEEGEWTDECDSANRDDSYARYYTFSLEEAAEVQLDLMSEVDTYMFLLEGAGSDGEVEEENDDIDYGVILDSRIGPVTLDAGTYTVEATTYSAGETGDFTLAIDVPEGEVEEEEEGTDGTEEEETGAALTREEEETDTDEASLEYTLTGLENGVGYDLQVRAASEDGEGEWSETSMGTPISPEPTPEPPAPTDPCVTDLGTLSADVSEEGAWTDECDSANREDTYARYYTFTLEEAAEVQLDLSSDEDTYIFLLEGAGSEGEVEEENDDIDYSRGILDSRIGPLTLDAGTYTVEATTFSAGETGEFTLAIDVTEQDAEPPAPSDSCVANLGTLTSDVSEEGEWTDECDSTNRSGRYARYYTFTLEAEAEVQIDLTSNKDTYLFLLEGAGADGEVEKENDDIDYGRRILDSRIGPVTLDAGTYTVEATTYSAGETGDFTLAIDVPE